MEVLCGQRSSLLLACLFLRSWLGGGRVDSARILPQRRRKGKVRLRKLRVADELAENDMQAAKEIIKGMPRASGQRQHLAQSIARDLARRDVKGALKWAESLETQETKADAMRHVVDQWAERDPNEAFAFAQDYSQGRHREALIRNIGRRVARHSPKKVLEWAGNVESPNLRRQLTGNALEEMAGRNPRQAEEYLGQIEDPALKSEVTKDIVRDFAREAPQTAARFLEE